MPAAALSYHSPPGPKTTAGNSRRCCAHCAGVEGALCWGRGCRRKLGLKVGVEASSCPTSTSAACTICTAMSMSGCHFNVPGCGGIDTEVDSYHSVPAGVSWPAGLVAGPWLAASQLVGGLSRPGRLDLLASAEDPTAQVSVSENNSLCPVPLFGPPPYASMHACVAAWVWHDACFGFRFEFYDKQRKNYSRCMSALPYVGVMILR